MEAVALSIAGWYLTSFGTLLLNKHLLGYLHVQPNTLAVVQMTSTAIYGAIKTLSIRESKNAIREVMALMNGNRGKGVIAGELEDIEDQGHSVKGGDHFLRKRVLMQMGMVGAMRFATVVLGLVSLKHIAASFTETIKASAPFFTVIICYLMLGEKTSPMVCLSLLPVAGGLVMVSYTELSYNTIGFMAAVSTNVIECVQNVFSKRLLAREYTASQLQFYTSLTALCLQAPIFIWSFMSEASPSPVEAIAASTEAPLRLLEDSNLTFTDMPQVGDNIVGPKGVVIDINLIFLLWIDGVLYHLQSVVAYVVMSYLSPVTVSVVNTLKRALLIWISVLVFGNHLVGWAKLGTAVCLSGALWYNVARQQVQKR